MRSQIFDSTFKEIWRPSSSPPWPKKFERLFSISSLYLNVLALLKYSSYQNKWKSIDAKYDYYEGCGRMSHSKDLIFSCVYWAVLFENEGDYIFDDNI